MQDRGRAIIATVVGVLACVALCIACRDATAKQAGAKYLPSPRQAYKAQKFWNGLNKEKQAVKPLDLYPQDWPNRTSYKRLLILNDALVKRSSIKANINIQIDIEEDVELDTIVKHIVDHVTGRGADALGRAYEFVSKYDYDYENTDPKGDWIIWSRLYAKQMYKECKGNCYRYASLMCWIARELGYDARTVSGEVLQSTSLGYEEHGWCEVRQGERWYVVDPDMHKFIPSRNFFMVPIDNGAIIYRR